jgi:hypothetical protein
MKIPREATATPKRARTVRIDCRGPEDRILTNKLSTPLNEFVYNHRKNLNESELIAYALVSAKLADGVDFVSQAYASAHGVPATLDPGMFVIPWYWMDDESPIEDCWQLASACGGRFYAGADGRFYYRNAYAPVFADAISHVYARSNFQDFEPRFEDRELYSGVSVETSPREVASDDVIWEPDDPISVPAGETITVTARGQRPIYAIAEVQFNAVSAGGRSLQGDIDITSEQYAQRIVFSITNNNALYEAYLNRFAVIGRPIVGSISHEALAESDDAFWANRPGRIRTIRGNAYIQTTAQAEFLARLYRDILDKPRLTYTLTKTPGQPSLSTGQRIRISDEKTGVQNHEAFVTGIQWTYGLKGGFQQTVTATNASGYLPYMDAPGYFVLDENVFDYDNHRIFY